MDSIERQRDTPEPIVKIFSGQRQAVDAYIKGRYGKSKQSTPEARIDALVFAASQLGWLKIEPLIHPGEDSEFTEKITRQWENAIEGARNNDWSAMKAVLQDYARISSSAAATRETLREENPQVACGEDDEQDADAFTYLILSL